MDVGNPARASVFTGLRRAPSQTAGLPCCLSARGLAVPIPRSRPLMGAAPAAPQVGCPMRCSFCATGAGGFARNLAPHEIVDQVLTVQEAFGQRVSNVGEPPLPDPDPEPHAWRHLRPCAATRSQHVRTVRQWSLSKPQANQPKLYEGQDEAQPAQCSI